MNSKFNFASNAGTINYRENADFLASVNPSASTAMEEKVFDNDAALQSAYDMMKRGENLEVTFFDNKAGVPCAAVEGSWTERFCLGLSASTPFTLITYITTGKFVEIPKDNEDETNIKTSKPINEELFEVLIQGRYNLKILPPHKLRVGQTIYPYLLGPGGKIRLRLVATDEIIEAIRNRK